MLGYSIFRLAIYSRQRLNRCSMTEHEWEGDRLPRKPRPAIGAPPHRRIDPVSHYLALEMPRESAAWLLAHHVRPRPNREPRLEPSLWKRVRGWILPPDEPESGTERARSR